MSKAKPVNEVNYEERGRRIFEMEIEELQKVSASLGDSFAQAVSMLRNCLENRGKIVVVGIGKSGNIGHKSLQLSIRQAQRLLY